MPPPPPPPVTPSPRRFIVKKEPAHARRTPLIQSDSPHPISQQFNAAPRFNFTSTPRPTTSQTVPAPTPGSARFSTPAPKSRTQDLIEDLSDDLPYDLHESIEINEIDDDHDEEVDLLHESAEENDGSQIEEPTPKRRRLTSPLLLDEEEAPEILEDDYTNDDYQVDLPSSSVPSMSSPPAPRRPTSSSYHKYILSTPAPTTPQAAYSAQNPFLKPPRFLPPDPLDANTSDPLPEHFSPHRKGHKYLPGGLASEVRDWLTNISSAIPAARNDPWVVRILIDEVRGGGKAGMTLVRGKQLRDGDVIDGFGILRVMLAGEGLGTGVQKGAKAEVGKVVGVKGPVWEVMIEGERWGVGVDWKVLN